MPRRYNLTSDCLERLLAEGQTAWKYLNNQAQQGALAYPGSKEEGWVIGSGQIEGYHGIICAAEIGL